MRWYWHSRLFNVFLLCWNWGSIYLTFNHMKPEQYLQQYDKEFGYFECKGCKNIENDGIHRSNPSEYCQELVKEFFITTIISILKEQLEEVEKEKEPKQLDNGECYFNESGDILYHLNESLKQKISEWEKLLN